MTASTRVEAAGVAEALDLSSRYEALDLSSRYRAGRGPTVLTGVQAVARMLIELRARELASGRRAGVFVSGYPGSPLAGLDLTLARIPELREGHDIHLWPAVNEELAATAVWGSQTISERMGPTRDGVIGVWYGKAPGFDRSGDAMRHGNVQGAHPAGGVLVLVGDDPSCKSSTLPSSCEPALAELMMPVLSPQDPAQLLAIGQYGVALSRASGCWVGIKMTTDVADGLWAGEVAEQVLPIEVPVVEWQGRPWTYRQGGTTLPPAVLDAERELFGPRWAAVRAFAAANPLNRIEIDPPGAAVGVVAAGKTYADLRQALADLGVGEGDLTAAGVRLASIAMPFPLDPHFVRRFAQGLREIIVVEEKRPFLETQVRDILYGTPQPPLVVGKTDERGRPLLPYEGELTAARIECVLRARLDHRLQLRPAPRQAPPAALPLVRTPFFCSGCPHNRSTLVPEGSLAGGGIGCHGMAAISDRNASQVTGLTQMGGEGAQWVGQAPFTSVPHIYQNLGDGTFFHSGQLAVQACIAAGVNITFKLLHNSTVAMTGGQGIPGAVGIAAITRRLHAMGVRRTVICADDPGRYRRVRGLAPGVQVRSRDDLQHTQRELRDIAGVTVLIYDQQCAAEARRLRRRGQLPAKAVRVVVSERVCEGCGDCRAKSNCLSLGTVATEFGAKTRIDQSSCNTDHSCLDGDCPSFVTVEIPAAPTSRRFPEPPATPEPTRRPKEAHLFLAGIGGTGIVTVNQVLAAAALADGLSAHGLDQTGLSQKAGPVCSHLHISASESAPASRLSTGQATGYLAFDPLVGADPRNLSYVSAATTTAAVVSSSFLPTGSMVTGAASAADPQELVARIASAVSTPPVTLDTLALAQRLFGDTIAANFLLTGAAYQCGLLPMTAASIERAITLNRIAVEANIAAFRWGRHLYTPGAADRLLGGGQPGHSSRAEELGAALIGGRPMAGETLRLARIRAGELVLYQGKRLARDYLDTVEKVWLAERNVTGKTELSQTVAIQLYRLTAYKDEYEVARLLIDPAFTASVHAQLPGSHKLRFQLHPPLLRNLGVTRKIAVGPWARPILRLLATGRWLRGTPLDPFAHTHVRRVERHLVSHYRQLVGILTAQLIPETYDHAVAVAAAADLVRGYEKVKLASVERYTATMTELGVGTPFASSAHRPPQKRAD